MGADNRSVADLAGRPWDVVVVGGGNAALVSALSAHDAGASVVVVERSDVTFRGGNSRHTRNIRCAHDHADRFNTGAYPLDELWRDLCGVGTGPSDEPLARLTVEASRSVPAWMSAHGALWQPPLAGTLHLGRTNRFFLGGGKALVNAYYRELARRRIAVVYDTFVDTFEWHGDTCSAVVVHHAGARHRFEAQAFVCASGGFEANLDWLARYWGDAVANYHIRGPRSNDGHVLRQLLDGGAATAGEERGFHSVAVDARSPRFDGGIATRIDAIPFGIVVNRHGQRFYDEGEDIWPKRYAIWGRNLAGQPDQTGYALWDATVNGQFLPPMYGAHSADTIRGLAAQVGLDPATLEETVTRFNHAVPTDARHRFRPGGLDGVSTTDLTPAKSNWAQPLDTPPFYALPMHPGITFTYLGVKVDTAARVQTVDGRAMPNVYAAGEIMSGNVLSSGYLAGFGMTIGTVWGRIAGTEAARHGHR